MAQLVADFVLGRLREWGVHRIFGYPGDGINAFLGALDRADGDPELIRVRHEETAALAGNMAAALVRGDPERADVLERSPRAKLPDLLPGR